jgi:hypothetical protein
MDIQFFKSTEDRTGKHRNGNKIFKEEVKFKICYELEEKQLQWFGHVKGMDKTRRALESKCKGKRCGMAQNNTV